MKAGDEILEINKKAAEDLNSAMLRGVLVQPSLCLTVRTYPETEAGQKLTQLPPRRTDGSLDLTDSPLRSVSSSQGTHFYSTHKTLVDLLLDQSTQRLVLLQCVNSLELFPRL